MPSFAGAQTVLDGYEIVREIHGSRSHIYLAVDGADGALVDSRFRRSTCAATPPICSGS